MILFSDPKKEYLKFKKEINKHILKTLNKGNYTLGEQTSLFESNFSNYINTKYSVAVNSGTDAIKISLMALGIGNDHEVITSSHTALATIAAIIDCGATPVIVDINRLTYNLDPKFVKKAITKKTRAIIPVHIYGQSSEMNSIKKIANDFNLNLIEDCAQSMGAEYFGKKVGSIGNFGCFSFYPTKNLSALGDGGMITTNNYKYFLKIKSIRQYGWNKSKSYLSKNIGVNSRIDEIQSAILNVKLKYIDKLNTIRNKIAKIYNNNLDNKKFVIPYVNSGNKHSYHLYVIQSVNRNKIIKELIKNNIYPGIHYKYPPYKYLGYKKYIKIPFKILNTENISNKIISIPNHPFLSSVEIKKIIKILNNTRI